VHGNTRAFAIADVAAPVASAACLTFVGITLVDPLWSGPDLCRIPKASQ
jgi:hypothetical protein